MECIPNLQVASSQVTNEWNSVKFYPFFFFFRWFNSGIIAVYLFWSSFFFSSLYFCHVLVSSSRMRLDFSLLHLFIFFYMYTRDLLEFYVTINRLKYYYLAWLRGMRLRNLTQGLKGQWLGAELVPGPGYVCQQSMRDSVKMNPVPASLGRNTLYKWLYPHILWIRERFTQVFESLYHLYLGGVCNGCYPCLNHR